LSYARQWPRKILFCCLTPPAQGGATPIASSEKVFQLLATRLRRRFIEKRVLYLRNYGEGVGIPWQRVFNSADRAVVEARCRQAGVEFQWKGDGRLCTRQVRPAVVTRPALGRTVWFNQAHMFHVASLDAAVREALLSMLAEDDLPNHAYYGDGAPIETAVIEEICHAYQQAEVSFPWQQGDVLLLDNVLVAHGRAPFSGPRQVLVAMGDPSQVSVADE
jgi:alpha-ketoglutarate-dependent taurine dioxygenase